jgi:hypothetical protein
MYGYVIPTSHNTESIFQFFSKLYKRLFRDTKLVAVMMDVYVVANYLCLKWLLGILYFTRTRRMNRKKNWSWRELLRPLAVTSDICTERLISNEISFHYSQYFPLPLTSSFLEVYSLQPRLLGTDNIAINLQDREWRAWRWFVSR